MRWWLLLTIWTLAACGAAPPAATTETLRPTTTMETGPTTTTTAREERSVVPGDLLDAMKADLGERTGTDLAAIEVVESQRVTWRDGSLGCPEPGQVYTQALVEGYRVVLEAEGREYQYHAAEAGHFILCENPQDGTVDA